MGNFRLDPSFEKAFLRGAEAERALRQATDEVAAKARTVTRHATIRAGIISVVGVVNGRMVGRVVATDFKSHWFEAGTVKMRAEPFLSTAAMALGYTLEATTKRA